MDAWMQEARPLPVMSLFVFFGLDPRSVGPERGFKHETEALKKMRCKGNYHKVISQVST